MTTPDGAVLSCPGGAGGACPGGAELRASAGGLTLSLADVELLRCRLPVLISVGERDFASPYEDVSPRSGRLVCRGVVRAEGAEFSVLDVFTWDEAGLRMRRRVRVRAGGHSASGFASSIRWAVGGSPSARWFLPGCVYGRNEDAPPYAIGAALGKQPVFVREDRLALPFAARYDPDLGVSVSFLHVSPPGSTVDGDDLADELTADGLGFGAFGDLSADEIGFTYPGSEGAVSYPPMWTAGIGNSQADSPVNPFPPVPSAVSRGWTRRYHPVRDGAAHGYELVLSVSPAGSFTDFVRSAWRGAWRVYRPRVRHADLAAVERACLSVLASAVVADSDTDAADAGAADAGAAGADPIGIPTWTDVFTGRPGSLQNTFSIGFVGRNLEVGYALLRASVRHDEPGWARLASELIDFWVRTSGSGGLCHTEWDRAARRWADDGIVYLRDQSEARTAVLESARWARPRPEWLAWCVAYGDWLAGHTGADGSLHRSYRLDGTPASEATNDGIHAAGFLARLGGDRYLEVASRVASYYWESFHRDGTFTGGTLDNPNCCDREAASLAMEAYLALHTATGERRWLDAARLAADFCESWIVGWDVPMSGRFFDASASSEGLGLITLGFSAVDTYLARHVGDFIRLASVTGDGHYRDVADLLLHNTKQMVQLTDEYGYAAPGYQIEHWSIGRGRGYGLNSGWLPWVATSHLLGIWAAEPGKGPRPEAGLAAAKPARGGALQPVATGSLGTRITNSPIPCCSSGLEHEALAVGRLTPASCARRLADSSRPEDSAIRIRLRARSASSPPTRDRSASPFMTDPLQVRLGGSAPLP